MHAYLVARHFGTNLRSVRRLADYSQEELGLPVDCSSLGLRNGRTRQRLLGGRGIRMEEGVP
jgi:hypothetical protein